MRKGFFTISLLSLILCPIKGRALDQMTPGILFQSTRSLGMGGANLAVPQGAYSAFFNPAEIASERRFTAGVEFIGGGSKEFIAAEEGASDLLEQAESFRLDNGGGRNVDVGALASIRSPFFNIGAAYRAQRDAWAPDENGGKLHWASREDLILFGGLGFSLFRRLLKIGAVTRIIDRAEIDDRVIPDTNDQATFPEASTLSYNLNKTTGRAITTDVGGSFVIPWAFLPTFSAVWRNLGARNFKSKKVWQANGSDPSGAVPNPLIRRMDAGFSLNPWLANHVRLRLAVDYIDVTSRSNYWGGSRIKGGMELDFYGVLQFRGGYANKEPSFGIGITILGNSLEAASYGVTRRDFENNVEQSERRYIFKYSINF